MRGQLDSSVVRILEEAGERWLSKADPRAHQTLLLHVGAGTLRGYDRTRSYWEQVQAILDGFFDSVQRAQICAELMVLCDLRARPEARGFFDRALAEIRLQQMARSVARGAMSSELSARMLR